MFTVAPAGIAAPFVPLVASVVVAVMLSPTALVFVQTLADDARTSVVPAAIVPVRAGAEPVLVGVLVFVDVVVLVGVVFVPVGRVTVLVGVAGALVVPPPVAVSLSVSLELSLFANAMLAASAESFLSAAESVFAESPEQPTNVIAAIARDVVVIRV
jgi:hypothetical protein